MLEQYKVGLIYLDESFAPDAEVPRSGWENVRAWARRRDALYNKK